MFPGGVENGRGQGKWMAAAILSLSAESTYSLRLDQSGPLCWGPAALTFEWLAALSCHQGGTSHPIGWPTSVMQFEACPQWRVDLFVSLFFCGSWKQRVFGAFPKKSSLACICIVFLAWSSVGKAVAYGLPRGKDEMQRWETVTHADLTSHHCVRSKGIWALKLSHCGFRSGSMTNSSLPQFSQTIKSGWWWVPYKFVARIKNSSENIRCVERLPYVAGKNKTRFRISAVTILGKC